MSLFDTVSMTNQINQTNQSINQPNKKVTKGGVLREAQHDDPYSVKPFLCTKRMAGTAEYRRLVSKLRL
jgi:hypothetical protein